MSAPPLIRCEGLVFVYPDGTRALDGIDLEIAAGERVVLTGPNGAGKTTLVRHWNGLLRPTAGTVSIAGQPAAGRHVADLARLVGLSFQDPSAQLFASTCRDEVAFGARNAGLRGGPLDAAIESALRAVGLLERAGTNPWDLGASKRRLLTIACALAMRPRVLVLDEPTVGLDSDEVANLERVVGIEAESGRAVVAITHDPRRIGSGFERVVRLERGRVVADDALQPLP